MQRSNTLSDPRTLLLALLAAMFCVGIASDQGQTCGPNAEEVRRVDSNGTTTITCRCQAGYQRSGNKCVLTPNPNGTERQRRLNLDIALLAQYDAQRAGLQHELAILDIVTAQQRESTNQLNRLRQDILAQGLIDSIGLAGNTAFLRSIGLSPGKAAQVGKVFDSYHLILVLYASKNASDEADITGDKETRAESESKVREGAIDASARLARLVIPTSAVNHIAILVKSANEAFATDLTGDRSSFEKVVLTLDEFSRVAAAVDPTHRVAALRSGGDVLDAFLLYGKLTSDQQSVRDADNSASYARGLVRSRLDNLGRQRDALADEIQTEQEGGQ